MSLDLQIHLRHRLLHELDVCPAMTTKSLRWRAIADSSDGQSGGRTNPGSSI